MKYIAPHNITKRFIENEIKRSETMSRKLFFVVDGIDNKMAAERLKRTLISFEIDPKTFSLSKKII